MPSHCSGRPHDEDSHDLFLPGGVFPLEDKAPPRAVTAVCPGPADAAAGPAWETGWIRHRSPDQEPCPFRAVSCIAPLGEGREFWSADGLPTRGRTLVTTRRGSCRKSANDSACP